MWGGLIFTLFLAHQFDRIDIYLVLTHQFERVDIYLVLAHQFKRGYLPCFGSSV